MVTRKIGSKFFRGGGHSYRTCQDTRFFIHALRKSGLIAYPNGIVTRGHVALRKAETAEEKKNC